MQYILVVQCTLFSPCLSSCECKSVSPCLQAGSDGPVSVRIIQMAWVHRTLIRPCVCWCDSGWPWLQLLEPCLIACPSTVGIASMSKRSKVEPREHVHFEAPICGVDGRERFEVVWKYCAQALAVPRAAFGRRGAPKRETPTLSPTAGGFVEQPSGPAAIHPTSTTTIGTCLCNTRHSAPHSFLRLVNAFWTFGTFTLAVFS